jgi:hypothetical protein
MKKPAGSWRTYREPAGNPISHRKVKPPNFPAAIVTFATLLAMGKFPMTPRGCGIPANQSVGERTKDYFRWD